LVEATKQGQKKEKKQGEEEELPPLIAWLQHRAIFQVKFNDVLEHDLEKIDAKLETHGKLLVGLDGKVVALRSQVTELDGRVTALDGKVTALDGKVTALDGKVTALDGKVDRLEQRVVHMDAKFEDRFGKLDDKMDLVLTLLSGHVQAVVPNARVASDRS
jgi:chromosome segregation ATPase